MAVAGAFIVPHPPLIVPEIGSQRVLLKGKISSPAAVLLLAIIVLQSFLCHREKDFLTSPKRKDRIKYKYFFIYKINIYI